MATDAEYRAKIEELEQKLLVAEQRNQSLRQKITFSRTSNRLQMVYEAKKSLLSF